MAFKLNPIDAQDAAAIMVGILNPQNDAPRVPGLGSVSELDKSGLVVSAAATLILNALFRITSGNAKVMREGLDTIVKDMRNAIDEYENHRRKMQ